MKKITQLLAFLGLMMLLCSNVSQPGVYNSGGMAFTMLFPEDSLAYKKVQMQEEKIYMKLYKGYAVVKGTYKMVNTTSEKLSFKMGYPIKGIYNGGAAELDQVSLDSIYKFKVKTNQKEVAIDQVFYEQNDPVISFSHDNWLAWQMDFLPNESIEVAVYFIVNTNSGKITKGYNKKCTNTFIYLLESGSVWKQPIVKGDFIVELKDNLSLEAIDGISEHFNFKMHPSQMILYGQKNNFSPTPKDNLIISYYKTMEVFDFQKIIKNEKQLYDAIDNLSQKTTPANLKGYTAVNPYEVSASLFGYFPIVLTMVLIYLPYLLMIVLGGFVLRAVFKLLKNHSYKK